MHYLATLVTEAACMSYTMPAAQQSTLTMLT